VIFANPAHWQGTGQLLFTAWNVIWGGFPYQGKPGRIWKFWDIC